MLPEAFLERMEQMLGKEYEDFFAALERERYQALRWNRLKIGADGRSAAEAFGGGDKVPWAEDGYYYSADLQPGKHPFHEAGLYYIQEPSAMAPAGLLAVRPGEKVLDLCAAPGGKSVQIAADLQGRGMLLCNEIHPARAKILSGNVERMGIRNAYVTNETPRRLAEVFPEYFDKILVDAPCSGEGMFRKNQAAGEEWSPENVKMCADRQDEILDCAAVMLRPGGRLVYSTCTFAPLENEGSVGRFIDRHGDFVIVPADKESLHLTDCDGVPAWGGGRRELEGTLRLWPHRIRGEGHFAAVLEKAGGVPKKDADRPLHGTVRGTGAKETGEFLRFCQETFVVSQKEDVKEAGALPGADPGAEVIRFGDHLYLASAGMPDPKGLKVLRPGLHLGELKKNRFEPSHALALALCPKDVRNVWNLESQSDALAYLRGETFPAQGEKGWYLICFKGFGMGWGKMAAGVMKNHYPKGLRVN